MADPKELDEVKEQFPFAQNKFDHDLYHDEDNTIQPIIRIKRTGVLNKTEKWKIYRDEELSLVLEGNKLTNKEKEFLRTMSGIVFLIELSKTGAKSFNFFKNELKKQLK